MLKYLLLLIDSKIEWTRSATLWPKDAHTTCREPPCYPTAPTPWKTLLATSTTSFSEEWKPVLHFEFSKLSQTAAHKTSQDWARRNIQSSWHPIRNSAGVLWAMLAGHPSAAPKAVNGLISNNTNEPKWHIFKNLLFKRGARSLSLLLMAAGIGAPKKSDFTGSLGNSGRPEVSPSSSLTPINGHMLVQHQGQGLPSPAVAVGSALWK